MTLQTRWAKENTIWIFENIGFRKEYPLLVKVRDFLHELLNNVFFCSDIFGISFLGHKFRRNPVLNRVRKEFADSASSFDNSFVHNEKVIF